ncbi:MAG: DNA mismatch repair endonuclease MutL, partial [Oscillospiraceae bacterium]|nr:DNA mismatch repair endonuclease MutL [Oscillospiraceae bacterium]
MEKIHKLPSHVADLIAAGEVVERPASAAKELIENAVDAGATAITAEIKSGGVAMLRVADDGCGMSEADAGNAFLRHATSKIRGESDLRAVKTLGFRGEALAALAAVSRIDLLTREPDALYGTALTIEAGEIVGRSEAGCPAGTTIVARDLFYNVPARQKFLKKDSTE